MGRLRRLAAIALEDFGLRRPVRAAAPVFATDVVLPPVVPVEPMPGPAPTPTPTDLPPGVVWHGSAPRRPELQRFCEHLEALRGGVS